MRISVVRNSEMRISGVRISEMRISVVRISVGRISAVPDSDMRTDGRRAQAVHDSLKRYAGTRT
jgi:hypothetical protein